MRKSLSTLVWHDGNLLGISFAISAKGKSSVVVSALIYSHDQASQREEIKVECEDVSRFCSSIDTVELKNNAFAGNISNGYLKDKTLWLYFTDGFVEIHAKKFRLATR